MIRGFLDPIHTGSAPPRPTLSFRPRDIAYPARRARQDALSSGVASNIQRTRFLGEVNENGVFSERHGLRE
jgi:hypothetical protein